MNEQFVTPGQITPFDIDNTAPLVDQALEATKNRIDDHAELEALKAELAQLRTSLVETAKGASRASADEVRSVIRGKPFIALATVAFVAYVLGATR